MPKPSRHPYRGQDLTVRELFNLPTRHPSLGLGMVGDRIRMGWPAEEAITLAPRARLTASKAVQATRDDAPDELPAAPSVAVSPVGVLEALGYDVVSLGRTPAGYAFVVRDGGAQ